MEQNGTNTTCKNGGTCIEGEGLDVLCSCPCQYTGLHCEENIFSCASNPCQNGATCVEESAGHFKCLCSVDWTGETCNTRATLTESDNEFSPLMFVIGGQGVIIFLLCMLSCVGFGLACKFGCRRLTFGTAEPQQ